MVSKARYQRWSIAILAASLIFFLSDCSSSPSAVGGSAQTPTSVAASSNNNLGKSTTTSPAPTKLLIVCNVGQGWEELDPASGRVVAQIIQSPDLSAYGSCENTSFGAFDTVGALGATSILQSLSPNLQDWAGKEGVGSKDVHACYTPTNSSNCVDDSGVSSTDFGQQSVEDSGALFNPATGDLWWTRNGDLMSNTVPSGTVVNNGPGALLSFTPQGAPMPFIYFDSPSGNVRLFENSGNGYSGYLEYGATSSLTSACLETQQQTFQNNAGAICGGTSANALANECDSNSGSTFTAGLSSDTTAVCFGNSKLDTVPLDLSSSSPSPNWTPLIPTTTQTIVSALVSPDGSTVYFLAASTTTGLTLYSTPSNGSGSTTTPTQITTLDSSNNSGSNSGPYLLGWYSSGKIVEGP